MQTLSNPAWTNRLLAKYWGQIKAKVGDAWMPHTGAGVKQRGQRKVAAKEYGCGHYGCVGPLKGRKGIVYKITSDASEIAFVAAYFTIPKRMRPEGLVRYHKIFLFPEQYRGRPVAIIWRDEAEYVGHVGTYWDRRGNYENRSWRIGSALLIQAKDCASLARMKIRRSKRPQALMDEALEIMDRPHAYDRVYEMDWEADARRGFGSRLPHQLSSIRGAYGLAMLILGHTYNAQLMQNEMATYEVGRCLNDMVEEQGLLMADVHLGNVGIRQGDSLTIITDPGHVVDLTGKFAGIPVPEL